MRYIGNKTKLLGWIFEHVGRELAALKIPANEATFLDACTGTASVAEYAVNYGFQHVVANDLLPFPANLARATLLFPLSQRLTEVHEIIRVLNALPPKVGFFSENYSQASGRCYFTDENAGRIDAMREYIRGITESQGLTTMAQMTLLLEDYLWACLLEAVSKVTNTTGTHGAYLKTMAPNALKALHVKFIGVSKRPGPANEVYQRDIAELLRDESYRAQYTETVLYIDPPYNSRQYGANYHLFSTLVGPDPVIKGKTGLPQNAPVSEFCKTDPAVVTEFFRKVLSGTRARIVAISYSSDSTVSLDTLIPALYESLPDDTRVTVHFKGYKRFRSAETQTDEDPLYEYLVLAVNDGTPLALLEDQFSELENFEGVAQTPSKPEAPTEGAATGYRGDLVGKDADEDLQRLRTKCSVSTKLAAMQRKEGTLHDER